MKTLIKILVLVLLLPGNVQAYEFFTPLSSTEIKLEVAYASLTLVDMVQTIEFLSKGVNETNPLIPNDATREEIYLYFGSAILSHAFIAYALPKELRKNWVVPFIVIESYAVMLNHKNGYGPKICINYLFWF